MLSNIDKIQKTNLNAIAICFGSGHRPFQILTLENSKNKHGLLDTPMPFVFLMAVHANIYGYWREGSIGAIFSGNIQMFPLKGRVLKGMNTNFQIKCAWVRCLKSAIGVFPRMWMNLITYFLHFLLCLELLSYFLICMFKAISINVILFHLIDLSPIKCVFKCLLIWSAREKAKSHWLHLIGFLSSSSSSSLHRVMWRPFLICWHGREEIDFFSSIFQYVF